MINITSMVAPESGWVVATHCPICKETTFMIHAYALKPTNGDYFRLNQTCVHEEYGDSHNMVMAMGRWDYDIQQSY